MKTFAGSSLRREPTGIRLEDRLSVGVDAGWEETKTLREEAETAISGSPGINHWRSRPRPWPCGARQHILKQNQDPRSKERNG